MANSIINSDDGVVSGQSGLKTSGGDNGVLVLQNNGTTNVALTAAGLVGIGTVAPQQKLHVAGAASTYVRVSSSNAGTGAGAVFVNNNTTWTLGAGAVGGGTRFEIADQTSGSNVRLGIDSAGVLQFNSGYGSAAAAYGCRAWVNFDGTGTPAVIASGNVSSITDSGTGTYRANFSIAMPDVNYAAFVAFNAAAANAFVATKNLATTGYVRVDTGQNSAVADFSNISVAVFR
jgi:hypothetical protein